MAGEGWSSRWEGGHRAVAFDLRTFLGDECPWGIGATDLFELVGLAALPFLTLSLCSGGSGWGGRQAQPFPAQGPGSPTPHAPAHTGPAS